MCSRGRTNPYAHPHPHLTLTLNLQPKPNPSQVLEGPRAVAAAAARPVDDGGLEAAFAVAAEMVRHERGRRGTTPTPTPTPNPTPKPTPNQVRHEKEAERQDAAAAAREAAVAAHDLTLTLTLTLSLTLPLPLPLTLSRSRRTTSARGRRRCVRRWGVATWRGVPPGAPASTRPACRASAWALATTGPRALLWARRPLRKTARRGVRRRAWPRAWPRVWRGWWWRRARPLPRRLCVAARRVIGPRALVAARGDTIGLRAPIIDP